MPSTRCADCSRSASAAADSYGALGDELWGIVDGRVARTLDVAAGVRPGWAADERDAFVHNIILGEWTADMRRADDDVRAVYRRAVAALDRKSVV